MFAGYVHKRTTPFSPPPMQKVYSVLWGTLLMDFENEEEARTSLVPKSACEVLGISEWDGHGRGNQYPYGLLLVTHTGATYYLCIASKHERDEWLLHIKQALECHFANPEILPFKPSKIIQNRPALLPQGICRKTKQPLSAHHAVYCRACGRGYSSSDYVNEWSTMLQIGVEDSEKVCSDCRTTQGLLTWFKTLTYLQCMTMHELTPAVGKDIHRYKASFKLRRRASPRLDMAAQLLDQSLINPEEFEELRRVDHEYRRENIYEESERLKQALDVIGADMHTIFGLLTNPASTDSGGRMSYFQVILKLLEIADHSPSLVDFYWPQLIHIHLCESAHRTPSALMKIDLLQQALLVMSQRYPSLALKLAWSLLATLTDYAEKKISQVQYAASVSLLMQLEMAVTGHISSVADDYYVRTLGSQVLMDAVKGSSHQLQELASELGALFLVRRRLQEMYDEEEAQRRLKVGAEDDRRQRMRAKASSDTFSSDEEDRDGDNDDGEDGDDDSSPSTHGSSLKASQKGKEKTGKQSPATIPEAVNTIDTDTDNNTRSLGAMELVAYPPSSSSSSSQFSGVPSCLQLLHRLCVGPATPSPVASSSASNNNDNDYHDGNDDNNISSSNHNDKEIPDHSHVCSSSSNENNKGGDPSLENPPLALAPVLSLESTIQHSGDGGGISTTSQHNHDNQINSNNINSSNINSSHSRDLAGVHDLPPTNCDPAEHIGFALQVEFLHRLTTIVDDLRALDRPLRGDALIHELQHLNEHPETLGWDPTTIAGEPSYRITRIVTEECRVFRTKARAPSLIVCECLREDLSAQHYPHSHQHVHSYNRHSNHHNSNDENSGNNIKIGCIDSDYFGNKDESKDESKDGDGGGEDDQLFRFRSKFVIRPVNANTDATTDPKLEMKIDPKATASRDLTTDVEGGVTAVSDPSPTTSTSESLSLSLPLPSDAPLPSTTTTTPPISSTTSPRTGSLFTSPPLSPPVSPTHLSPTKRKASLTLTASHSQQDVELANTIRTQVDLLVDGSIDQAIKEIQASRGQGQGLGQGTGSGPGEGRGEEGQALGQGSDLLPNGLPGDPRARTPPVNDPRATTTTSSSSSSSSSALSIHGFRRLAPTSKLLSANRKSSNFHTILTSASTDDFSLLVGNNDPNKLRHADIFEKTSKLSRIQQAAKAARQQSHLITSRPHLSHHHHHQSKHQHNTSQLKSGTFPSSSSAQATKQINSTATVDSSPENSGKRHHHPSGLSARSLSSDDLSFLTSPHGNTITLTDLDHASTCNAASIETSTAFRYRKGNTPKHPSQSREKDKDSQRSDISPSLPSSTVGIAAHATGANEPSSESHLSSSSSSSSFAPIELPASDPSSLVDERDRDNNNQSTSPNSIYNNENHHHSNSTNNDNNDGEKGTDVDKALASADKPPPPPPVSLPVSSSSSSSSSSSILHSVLHTMAVCSGGCDTDPGMLSPSPSPSPAILTSSSIASAPSSSSSPPTSLSANHTTPTAPPPAHPPTSNSTRASVKASDKDLSPSERSAVITHSNLFHASLSEYIASLPTDRVFEMAEALQTKNTAIQACHQLFQESRIDVMEYEKLLRTELLHLEDKARNEAMAATGRLKNVFGDSWVATKERVLGTRYQHCEDIDINEQVIICDPVGRRSSSLLPPSPSHSAVDEDNAITHIENATSATATASSSYPSIGEKGTIDPSSTTSSRAVATATSGVGVATSVDGIANADAVPLSMTDTTRVVWPAWDLRAFIVKSNDDLRQEVCCIQIMQLCQEIFTDYGLTHQLWLKPYRIVSTGSSSGLVQVLTDALSLDAIKKTPGYTNLPQYFKKTFGTSPERLLAAKRNFAASLAAYSLFSYVLQIKDRHNGNLLMDTEGHIIQIDFGFLLSLAPGGTFSLETAPFKLTEEMVEVLGGLESQLFGEFVKGFTSGFLALRANVETILSNLKTLANHSPFPCFVGKDALAIIDKVRGRFRADLSLKETVQHCLDLIISSYGAYGTKQYDSFQWYTNGIMP